MSAALADDAVARRESEAAAGAVLFRGEKRLKQMRLHFIRHAGAVVGDVDQDIVAVGQWLRASGRLPPIHAQGAGAERKPAALRHRVARIDREIHNDLGELARIHLDVRRLARRGADDIRR